jgi:uncharacterized membrane protein YdbT with pleckstrin-like domain
MAEWIKGWVLRVSRVPEEPHVPDGSPDSILVFRAGKNYLRWSMLLWLIAHAGVLLALIFLVAAIESGTPRMSPWGRNVARLAEILAIVAFLISAVLTYFERRLDFELRWYIVTDRSLRIRSGIFSTQELTMTFANIQEIRVAAGPLQLLLGLADVEVHSAGGGSSTPGTKGGHVGRFQGVDDANMIRDLIVERLRIYRGSGLGEHPEARVSEIHPSLVAAQAVLQEARALRASLETIA